MPDDVVAPAAPESNAPETSGVETGTLLSAPLDTTSLGPSTIACRLGSPPVNRPAPPPAEPHPECANALMQPDKAMVVRVIHSRDECYFRCFEAGLRPSPSLANRVTVRFVVADGSGVVRSAKVESFEGVTAEVAACVADEVLDLDFPAPLCGDVKISYPFVFGPR